MRSLTSLTLLGLLCFAVSAFSGCKMGTDGIFSASSPWSTYCNGRKPALRTMKSLVTGPGQRGQQLPSQSNCLYCGRHACDCSAQNRGSGLIDRIRSNPAQPTSINMVQGPVVYDPIPYAPAADPSSQYLIVAQPVYGNASAGCSSCQGNCSCLGKVAGVIGKVSDGGCGCAKKSLRRAGRSAGRVLRSVKKVAGCSGACGNGGSCGCSSCGPKRLIGGVVGKAGGAISGAKGMVGGVVGKAGCAACGAKRVVGGVAGKAGSFAQGATQTVAGVVGKAGSCASCGAQHLIGGVAGKAGCAANGAKQILGGVVGTTRRAISGCGCANCQGQQSVVFEQSQLEGCGCASSQIMMPTAAPINLDSPVAAPGSQLNSSPATGSSEIAPGFPPSIMHNQPQFEDQDEQEVEAEGTNYADAGSDEPEVVEVPLDLDRRKPPVNYQDIAMEDDGEEVVEQTPETTTAPQEEWQVSVSADINATAPRVAKNEKVYYYNSAKRPSSNHSAQAETPTPIAPVQAAQIPASTKNQGPIVLKAAPVGTRSKFFENLVRPNSRPHVRTVATKRAVESLRELSEGPISFDPLPGQTQQNASIHQLPIDIPFRAVANKPTTLEATPDVVLPVIDQINGTLIVEKTIEKIRYRDQVTYEQKPTVMVPRSDVVVESRPAIQVSAPNSVPVFSPSYQRPVETDSAPQIQGEISVEPQYQNVPHIEDKVANEMLTPVLPNKMSRVPVIQASTQSFAPGSESQENSILRLRAYSNRDAQGNQLPVVNIKTGDNREVIYATDDKNRTGNKFLNTRGFGDTKQRNESLRGSSNADLIDQSTEIPKLRANPSLDIERMEQDIRGLTERPAKASEAKILDR